MFKSIQYPYPKIHFKLQASPNLDCSKPNWLKIEGVKAWWLSHGKGSAARHGSWCSSPSVITCIQYGRRARGPSDMIGDFVGQKLLNSSPQKHGKTSNDLKFPPASLRLAISFESFDAWKKSTRWGFSRPLGPRNLEEFRRQNMCKHKQKTGDARRGTQESVGFCRYN